MQITDVSVTMLHWKSAAWRTASGAFGGQRLLGIVTVHTDAGVAGQAFLGSSRQGADAYAGPLIECIKPAVMGANPLDIGAIWQRMWKLNRSVSTNAIGAVDVALWDVAGKVAGLPIHRLRGDVAVTGGITPLIKIAHLAEAFRMKCEIHHGGNSLNNVANLHVIMAINNCDYYEVFPASGANKFALVKDIEVDDQGLIYAPEKSGLGYEIDWELVKQETVQVVR